MVKEIKTTVVVYLGESRDEFEFKDCDDFEVNESGALLLISYGRVTKAFADGQWNAVKLVDQDCE